MSALIFIPALKMGPTISTPGHEPTNHSPKLSLDDRVTAVVYVSTSLCDLRNRKHDLLTGFLCGCILHSE